MSQVIQQTLDSLTLGQPEKFQSMVMFPVFRDDTDTSPAGYLGLDIALKDEVVSIEEASEGGSVPDLIFKNLSEMDILLVEGDHLIGAKQNRTLNTSILAAAGASFIIPVSCVEQGRWSYRSRKFGYSDEFQFAKGRRGKMSSVDVSMKRSRDPLHPDRSSDQGEVWSSISAKEKMMNYRSDTGSMDDIYKSRTDRMQEFESHFPYQEGQVGALFMVADDIAGLELFDSPDMFKNYLPRITRSYILDAMEWAPENQPNISLDEAVSFIRDVSQAKAEEFNSISKGKDARLESDSIIGAGLVVDDTLLHFSAFRKQPDRPLH